MKISFKPLFESSSIYEIYIDGKLYKVGEKTAEIHFSKRISEDMYDEVTIYIPRGNGSSYMTSTFTNPHCDAKVFAFAKKYIKMNFI